MNVLILGSGAREHALAWKIKSSSICDKLIIAPGNGGTSELGLNVDVDVLDFDDIDDIIEEHEINCLVVGPEAPLVEGIADFFEEKRPELLVIGPNKEAAQLEGSKAFAKHFMQEYNIPTAGYIEVDQDSYNEGLAFMANRPGPYVLKADGLAAGKGVLILNDREDAKQALHEMLNGKFGKASRKVVIEEFLDGIEFSVFVLTDGQYYAMLPQAKDYKRIGEGDTGLNTGGMGAVSPVPFVDEEVMSKVRKKIILPTLSGLQDRKINYQGFIFFGLILVAGDPYVIEYNCRLGDPETEVILPRIENDLLELFEAIQEQELYEQNITTRSDYAATVMMVSGGYPESYKKGKRITNIPNQNNEEQHIFHAGTMMKDGELLTNGGRVLAITSLADDITKAVEASLKSADKIDFEGKYYRHDIGFDL